jgi:hypothetical protein
MSPTRVSPRWTVSVSAWEQWHHLFRVDWEWRDFTFIALEIEWSGLAGHKGNYRALVLGLLGFQLTIEARKDGP